MDAQFKVLDLFNALVVEDRQPADLHTEYAHLGFVTDFVPTQDELAYLEAYHKPLSLRTLFTVDERENGDVIDLLQKQILHYIECYGLGMPGDFTVPLPSGETTVVKFVTGWSRLDLTTKVWDLLYSNAPIKDSVALKEIIDEFKIDFDINQVANNEMRVGLFDVYRHVFESGDDAVRWMCHKATGSLMLIKSREVIQAIKESEIPFEFLMNHELPLAQVFNRHKRLIMAAKNEKTRGVINRISRRSKKAHVPIRQHISKSFVPMALADAKFDTGVLSKISVRDKFKYLNLLAYKRTRQLNDAFMIRNGKIFVREDRKVYRNTSINRVERAILESLKLDFQNLDGTQILLDKTVDYGLPISRKQTLGRLPYGTRITVDSPKISSGIWWHNDGGARDLDLSTVDEHGSRVGWGAYSGYDDQNIIFSGDVVNAPREGAMEFMTSANQRYGLFVNVFSGDENCEMELVIGEHNDGDATSRQWIDRTHVREKHVLESRGCLLGYVHDKSFVVYAGRVNGGRMTSDRDRAVAARGTFEFWTVQSLFDTIGVEYSLDKDPEIEYDHDLTYGGFSFDNLEALLLRK